MSAWLEFVNLTRSRALPEATGQRGKVKGERDNKQGSVDYKCRSISSFAFYLYPFTFWLRRLAAAVQWS
jgi:hypothetical protein